MQKLVLLLTLTVITGVASAQTSIPDSVKIDRSFYTASWTDDNGARFCGAGILAIFPDQLEAVWGAPRNWSLYHLKDSAGENVSWQSGDITRSWSDHDFTNRGFSVPPGNRAFTFYEDIAFSVSGQTPPDCPNAVSRALAKYNTISLDWWAHYVVPPGVPAAAFGWEQLGATDPPFVSTNSAVLFDASFESGHSRETEPTGPKPVVGYAWDFGDSTIGTGPLVNHTFTDVGTYIVTLTVTDDDGDTAEVSHVVAVTSAILEYRIREDVDIVTLGDTVTIGLLVENKGVGVAKDVHIPRTFRFTYKPFPVDQVATLGDPLLAADTMVVDIDPGDSVFVEQQYVVTGMAKTTVDNELRDVAVELEPFVTGIAGEDEAGEDAPVQDVCQRPQCINSFVIGEESSSLVNSVEDYPDDDLTDGVCSTGNMITLADASEVAECTLRAAIESANADASIGEIMFDIEGAGPHRLTPATALPPVMSSVNIDATSQPGYSVEPLIELDGSDAGANVDGLSMMGGGAKLSGFKIDGFSGNGVFVQAVRIQLTRMHIGTGFGNGLHGLLARGNFDNLVVGMEDDPESGNMIGNSGGHGIYLEGPDNEALSKNAHISIAPRINHNLIGLFVNKTQQNPDPVIAPNALNGICMRNVLNTLAMGNTIGNSGKNGIEILGSEATGNKFEGNDIGGYFKRIGNAFQKLVPMGNGENGIFAHSGAFGNNFGPSRLGGRPNTVVSNKQYGLRLLSSKENIIESSLFGVVSDSTDATNNKHEHINIGNFGNILGGLCIEESEGNVVKKNIVSNNGTSSEHAGILLMGLASKSNLIIANLIGTNRLGGLLGNEGSGILLSEGANNNTMGGEAEGDGNVVGGNTGNGIYLKGESLEGSLQKSGNILSLINANKLIANNVGGGFFGIEEAPMILPNGLNGLCLLNASNTIALRNAFLANLANGVEIMGPQSIGNIFGGNDIGGLAKRLAAGIVNVLPAGNTLDGVHMHSMAGRNVFKGLGGRKAVAISNRGYAFRLSNSHNNKMSGGWIGLLGDTPVAGGKQAGAELGLLGNGLGGFHISNSANTVIGLFGSGNVISNNGADSTTAGVRLVGSFTKATKLIANIFGTTENGMSGVGNSGPAVMIEAGVTETTIGGEQEGEGNTIAGGGLGGISAIGTALTKVVGNLFGLAPDGVTALPNFGTSISFVGAQRMSVLNNIMQSDQFNSIAFTQSSSGLLAGNTIVHDGLLTTVPAIAVAGVNGMLIGSESNKNLESPGNEIVAHEAVHVIQSAGVEILGATILAPTTSPGGPEHSAIKISESFGVKVGGTLSGNKLDLGGGKGLVIERSNVSATSNEILNADDAIFATVSSIVVASTTISSSKTGMRIVDQSQAILNGNRIETSTGTSSGIHFENSGGSVTGSSITMDAGDAIWLNGSSPLINGNNITDNTGFGVFNNDPSILVNARDNWWGDDTGPAGEGPGNGDRVSDFVDYAGWEGAAIGIVLSTDTDSVVVVPGDSVFLPVAVQNVILPEDVADVSVTDSEGWLASSNSFSLPTGFSPSPFVARLAVPSDATTENVIAITAESQTEPSLVDNIVVVVVPATSAASLSVAAFETSISLEHASSIIDVVANESQSANRFDMYYFSVDASTAAVTDERVLSASNVIVRPIQVMARSWAVQSEVPTAIASQSVSKHGTTAAPAVASATSSAVASAYRFDACFSTTGLEAGLGALDNALVVYRRYSIDDWSPLPTTRRAENSTEFLCATGVSDFGWFSVASAIAATPSPPALTYPTADLTGVGSDADFDWSEAVGADSYEIEVATDENFLVTVVAEVTPDDVLNASDLAVNTRHYWRVRSGGLLGFGPWSPVRSFTTSATGVDVETPIQIPKEISLEANYPNPFSDQTTITYNLPESDHIRIDVFDLQGRRVQTLVDSPHAAGVYSVEFDARSLASGVYFYRMMSSRAASSRSMVVVR